MKKAILDRIEDGKAVFLLEPDNTEWLVEKTILDEAIKEGDVVTISDTNEISKQPQETEDMKKRIAEKLEKLRGKN
ncbi:DUF3006 domain-containing protein [Listeria seeligeri]|uniref:DUF3006 domain-containing protein n=1 Tax=Listeria seeligeri TaxID=1640 RepID=A0A7X0X0M7_LISSE|nr:DUF3006 domain-containing protein [Listeria seeligeri]EFS03756.1 conserved hypothetical protein [Listeria seeligeri FSL S4-171]MBC1485347.1 DUF3006 domain-containing protein [Listeria seeligeri]MBC1580681.1 DUF3006 domain-containing protein [Listeria seeligeri]MBC1584750.1 DUF3006 domain-containing protein [Listeria seeligeri]MBC1592374.1 DUF3006 domain-containing protein [Listeria seeligeri]